MNLSRIAMASHRSICVILNEPPVIASIQERGRNRAHNPGPLVEDESSDNDMVLSGLCGYKGQCNNIALGTLDFKHVSSQLIASGIKQTPTIGDVCITLMPLTPQSEEYAQIVDLYNTYAAKGSSVMANACINNYARIEELCIPAIPIHTFVSEWNKSLQQFNDTFRYKLGSGHHQTVLEHRMSMINSVTALATENVPIVSDHLWFALHCIVSRPCLVKQVVKLVGSIASMAGRVYHTGKVENTTVPGKEDVYAQKLYLIAKSVPASGYNRTVLGDDAGATLGLIWVSEEDELYDHLQNSRNCYYVHIGTEAGNTFRCNGSYVWRHYAYSVFEKMTRIGQDAVSKYTKSTSLAGNLGDSARSVNRA